MSNLDNEIRGRAVGYISGAFGLVAGLAWNEAIVGLINVLFPLSKNSVLAKFVYAIILTVVVVVVVMNLDRLLRTEKEADKK
jgi:hypothetical protein